MKGDRDEGGGIGKQAGRGGSYVKNHQKCSNQVVAYITWLVSTSTNGIGNSSTQVKQVAGGEGLDVLQGGGHRPHLHPPLRHHLHALHLPGSQRVTNSSCHLSYVSRVADATLRLYLSLFLLAEPTPWVTMRSQSLQSGDFHQQAWRFFSK